ncbi:MAG: Sporulation factor SpoIIGA [Firmicutes bacterium ADurb.Bin193]|nr:MAG: Sporulation factor SpoIIGA [Firmicutes bacterium ADurb.Bin193]
MQSVYIDEVFLLNFIINYMLLFVTKRIIRARASQPRLVLGSIIGSAYAVFMLLPHSEFFYSFISKLLFSLSLVAITYNIKKFRQYIRTVAVFYMVSFAFGGAAYAVAGLMNKGVQDFVPFKILATSTVIAYFSIMLVASYCKRLYIREKSHATVLITVDGETSAVSCFLDTGNSLYDPISDSPVMIAELSSVSSILPKEVSELVKTGTVDKIPDGFSRRIRLIPYSSIGKEGVIIGFKPDRVQIGEKVICDIVVGLCENSLSQDNTYTALLNPAAMA